MPDYRKSPISFWDGCVPFVEWRKAKYPDLAQRRVPLLERDRIYYEFMREFMLDLQATACKASGSSE
jgi:hypothetical protein